MSSTRIPSPAHSQGVRSTPRQRRFRSSHSVGSPALSTTSMKLSSMQRENRKDSFTVSPLPSRRSVLSDNTEVEMPNRRSWWKRLDDNSKDVMDYLDKRKQEKATNVEELLDAEILSQENKNYSIDLPESSESESIRSIVLPQRKLFTQKDQSQKVYKNIMDKRENLERLQKSKVNYDNTIHLGKKDLFNNGRERSKPAFPAALLNISLDKTELNKKDKDISKQGQVRNLFGNRAGTKRKNMFAQFIVSDSEDEIPDIPTKVFGFTKKSDQLQPRAALSDRFRATSPASDITDVEFDEWKLLPSSTMVENQFGNLKSNTPVKKPRLSQTMPMSEESIKSKSDKVRTSNRSFTSSNKILKNKSMEDISKNKTITEKNVQSDNSKIKHVTDEIVKVIETYSKVSDRPQNEVSLKDLPMVHHDSRKSKADDNVNNSIKISQNISKKDKNNLQITEEYVTGEENDEKISDVEVEQIVFKNNEENLQEDEENEASEENQEESGSDNEISQNICENKDSDQEEDINEEDLQEDENNDEDQEEDKEVTAPQENVEEMDDIEIAQNIGTDLQENEEYEADKCNQDCSNNENRQNNSKSIKDVQDEVGSKSVNSLQENENHITNNHENRVELSKMEIAQYISKIQEQSDELQINVFTTKETIEGNKTIDDEKDKDANQKVAAEVQTKNSQTRSISFRDLNKSQGKDKTGSRDDENKDVLNNIEKEEKNETRANTSNGSNKSQRNNKTKSRDDQESVQNEKMTVHSKPEQSKINVTHDTTGRNRERVELEVKSPENVRNYIATEMECLSPTGPETGSRKTRSVIKLTELRPSLAPLRESTGISDGTYNSSVERSGWDSHRTTRKTLRQTFGKDFTPRKSLRALVLEKSAKRQTYGFDVTTKVPQACSTRLPENMHDITNDEFVDVSKTGPVETKEDGNKETNNEKTLLKNSSRNALEQRHLTDNETRLKMRESVKNYKQTAESSDILHGKNLNSRTNQNTNEICEERMEYQHMEKDIKKLHEMVLKESDKKIQDEEDDGDVQTCYENAEVEANDGEIQGSQNAEVVTGDEYAEDEASDEEMQGHQNTEVETANEDAEGEPRDEEIQDSRNAEVETGDEDAEDETSDEEMQYHQNTEIETGDEDAKGEARDKEIQDSRDIEENEESDDIRQISQNIEEGETDEENESYQEVGEAEESEQEMLYSEDDEAQVSEDERMDSQDNEVESEEERAESQNMANEESDEGRRYSSKITLEAESDEENDDLQKSSRDITKQRYFVNNSTREQSSNFTEESNREHTFTRKQNIMEILQKLKKQNMEMNRQAELAVRNSLKNQPLESFDVFKVPLRPRVGLRPSKAVPSKPKPKTAKSIFVGVENLPPEVLEDFKYKPPKRYRPSNASWITKRLYKFLETKLEPKYDYKARIRAEKLAEILYEFTKETRRRNVADSKSVDSLKNEMARLGIVSTHFEFNQFFYDFMPREIRIKVVPDIVNKIPLPRDGIFSNIIR